MTHPETLKPATLKPVTSNPETEEHAGNYRIPDLIEA